MALYIACSLTGCDSGPTTHSVKGKVVVKGSTETPAGGTVLFQSVENPEIQASGYIEEDGTFELYSNQGKAGLPAGEYRVLVQSPELEASQRRIVDNKYRSYETSGLTRTIDPGENDFTIELEPPKGR
jgi:hypothetical protein